MNQRLSRWMRTGSALSVGTALTFGAICIGVPQAHAETTTQTVVVNGMELNNGGNAVINDLETQEVAPGLFHVSYERLDTAGWQQIDVLKAELSDSTVKMKYLSPDTVSGTGATVTEMVDDNGAIAGVNLDRFDINNSWAASGWGVSNGKILKSGNDDASASVGMTSSGLGALVDLALEGSAVLPDGEALSIVGVNTQGTWGQGVVLYNSHWGTYTRNRLFGQSSAGGIEVWIDADGKVIKTAQSTDNSDTEIPEGVQILAAFADRAAATSLRTLELGDEVEIGYDIKDNVDVTEAGGAWHRLLRDGEAVSYANEDYYTGVNPRTMIGFSKDKKTAYFVVVDGRQGNAKGMNFAQQQDLMSDLGAWDAINADGGGSSQMNIRHAGDTETTIENSPSDGYERLDGDGMGFVLAQPGSGTLLNFAVTATQDDDDALRVFPGSQRALTAKGYDESGSAVEGEPNTWRSSNTSVLTVEDGVVTGVAAGNTTVTARNGVATGSAEIQVLGPMVRMEVDENVVNLEKEGSSQEISFSGYDSEGFRAPLDGADLTIGNTNPDAFSVEATDEGKIKITATAESGTAMLTFTKGEHKVQVTVAVPLEIKVIDDFSDISGWSAANDRAPNCTLETGEGHDGTASLKLNYDFTKSTATRGCYGVAPGAVQGQNTGIDIPGRPQKLSVWIKGDTKGALLRLQVVQGNGVTNWIDGPDGAQSLHVTWDGWQRVDFTVPSSFTFPLKFQRIRVLETVAAKQYTGSLEFSQIFAYLPPDGTETPSVETFEDPTLTETGSTDDSSLRVAVLSDAQFVAAEPDSGAVAGARDALREIVAAKPDVLLINGDFVDEASTEDFALAKQILEEELADATFPWYYVPGNHEIMGSSISNFEAAFGENTNTFDLKHTRFIGLDSSTGKLQSDFEQVKMLRKQLDDASEDPSITGVVVYTHMPIDDPLPTDGSQLTDREEAQLLEDWVTEFRAESGKSIAVVNGHVGVFNTSSVDGVPMVINGNSGKSPASTPEDGGFTGWTMLGIEPSQGKWASADGQWLSDEVRTRVDSLTVTEPSTELDPGDQVELNPTVLQDETRTVPVEWPVSYRWDGSDSVYVGDTEDAPATAIAAIDPQTSTLTALREGTGTATLSVNDATEEISFSVGDASVTVSGSAVTGQVLSAAVGEWAAGRQVSYQWLRDGEPIVSATSATYQVQAADVGHRIEVAATVSGDGQATITATGAPADPIAAAARQDAVTVTIGGSAVVGDTLTAAGDWDSEAVVTYQWLRDGQAISKAVSSEYNVANADKGHRLQVRVTAVRSGYLDAVGTSAQTGVVAAGSAGEVEPVPATVKAGTVRLSGKVRVGSKVTVALSGWEKGASFVTQWYRNGKAIAGATARSYTPVAADLGKKLSIRVIGVADAKVSVAKTSASALVAKGQLAKGKVAVKGTAKVGRTLTAKASGFGSGTKLTYRWTLKGKVVGKSAKLKVPSKAKGAKLTVKVTVKKSGYTTVTRTAKSKTVRR